LPILGLKQIKLSQLVISIINAVLISKILLFSSDVLLTFKGLKYFYISSLCTFIKTYENFCIFPSSVLQSISIDSLLPDGPKLKLLAFLFSVICNILNKLSSL